jgi:hypothetical protein
LIFLIFSVYPIFLKISSGNIVAKWVETEKAPDGAFSVG